MLQRCATLNSSAACRADCYILLMRIYRIRSGTTLYANQMKMASATAPPT